ncbi:triose-phosphate transporter family-domain-containing protein [Abortiporus biennis]|nr:triose-phosphate transporter family-domain-containing protein [Abortiporus biennis]
MASRPPPSYEEVRTTAPIEELEDDYEIHLASLVEKKRLWWRNALINSMFIASWFLFATILSVYNKWMFSKEHFGFPAPLFVTTMHMFVQLALASACRYIWPRSFRPDRNPAKSDYLKKAVPTGVATALDIGLSNLSLKMITLSFYTMCKSSSLVFVLLFAFLFRLETFSLRLIGVITLIVAGVVLMVATETHFILDGFLLVITGSALGGLRWSLTQLLLKNKNMGMDNPAATIFWLAPIMGFSLALISLIWEHWLSIFGTHFFANFGEILRTSFFLTAPGVVAFCMVLSEFYIIQRAGVVPMSIAGIAKEVTTITVSAWFFGDELTPLNITGVAITVCGIALFTYHKYRKSLDSPVPLDAHGNPIAASSQDEFGRSSTDVEELQPLTEVSSSPIPNRTSNDAAVPGSKDEPQVLFDISSEEEDSLEDGKYRTLVPSQQSNGNATH